MQNKIYILALAIVMITAFSCKKQEDLSIDKIDNGEVSFSPLEVGNYWIYEVSLMDKTGQLTFVEIDSTYIVGTKDFNGNTYYEYNSSTSATYKQYLRDSASYLIDEKGEKFFYHKNNADTIEEQKIEAFGYLISHIYRVIYHHDELVKCVAGDFPAIEARYTIEFPLISTKTTSYNFYSLDIGLILRADAADVNGNRNIFSMMRWGKAE